MKPTPPGPRSLHYDGPPAEYKAGQFILSKTGKVYQIQSNGEWRRCPAEMAAQIQAEHAAAKAMKAAKTALLNETARREMEKNQEESIL